MQTAPRSLRVPGWLLAVTCLVVAAPAALVKESTLKSTVYVSGLSRPVAFVQHPADPGVQFVVEQGGLIRVVHQGQVLADPFLDLSDAVAAHGERGLLGLAFAPDFAVSRRFFVSFSRPDGHIVVARFKATAEDPLVADASSRFDLRWSTGLRHIEQGSGRSAGHLAFGPDGYLYIGTGDGAGQGAASTAQSVASLLGKMLRVDVGVPDADANGFKVPAGNPYLGAGAAARPEIWAVGLSNPGRWSFDSAGGGTGALVIGDAGQVRADEINYQPANRGGRNYGWNVREGASSLAAAGDALPGSPSLVDPVFELDRGLSSSIVGGVVYRGRVLGAEYAGRYFFADAPGGRVYSVALALDSRGEARASDFREHTTELGQIGEVSAFGVDAAGELYLVSSSSGTITRIVNADPPPAATLVSPSGTITTSRPTYVWNAVSTSGFYYLWVSDRDGIRVRQWFPADVVGCGSGTGTCSFTPAERVTPGSVTWWVQTYNEEGEGPWSAPLTFVASVPKQVTTIAPAGSISTRLPTYSWNASALATHYYLWVADAAGTPAVRKWYTAAEAGCAAGTGTCTITPNIPIRPGPATWWIQTWNDAGYGAWSVARTFSIDPPGAATLVSPTGSIGTATPTYTWNAVAAASHYYLWVNDADGTPRIQTWYTAAEVGCAAGTGTCSIAPAVTLPEGAGTWWIQTWSTAGFGPWSTAGSFAVSLGITFTSSPTATFTTSVLGHFAVTTNANPAVTSITLTGALPAGMAFVDHLDGTGDLGGNPAPGTGGTYTLTFTAINGVNPQASQTFTLVVQQPPAFTSAATTTFSTGSPGSFTVTTDGHPDATLTVDGTLPGGVTFVDNGDGTGTLAGAPDAGTGGTYPLTITADNGVGGPVVQAFVLTVTDNAAITSADATTFTAANPGTFTITASGVPAPAITLSGTLPSGVTFADNGDGTATLAGTPAVGTGGVYPLTITADNGTLPTAMQAFTLTVAEPALITSAVSATFAVGSPGSFTVTTTGQPAPTITATGTLPDGVTFVDNGDGTATLSGTPAAATGGLYPLVLEATNGVGPVATQNFTLTVNQAPAFTSAASTTFTVGEAGSFTVTTSGFPAIATIVRGGAALPANVTYTDNGDGTATLSGTPAPGTAGAYAITFTINNGVGGNVVQGFTLNVNEAPAITSAASDTFTVGTPDTFTVTATGFPTPTVTHTSGTLPAGITFTSATRVLAGTATQTGAFPITFTAANGVGADDVQSFTLNVVCPAITVTPTIMPDGLYQTAYAPVDFNQTGSTGTTFTWSATGLPAGMVIDINTGVVSGTPTDTVMNAAVTITVTDNFACQGVLNTTLTIRPVADNDTYTGGVGHTQFVVGSVGVGTPHVLVNDNVKNGDSGPGVLSVTFPASSANGAVLEGATDGTFVYTPNLNFAGPSDSFTYTLTDGNGVTNTGTVTIALSGLVWYVNNSGGNGDGRSHNPFNTLASAATASVVGSIVYVHSGAGSTPGDLAMDAGQTLFGQGAAFALNGLTIASGAAPTLSGTVTLANNALVRAVAFAPAGQPALVGNGLTQPVTIDQVAVTGGTSGLSLTNVTGAVTVSNSAFVNTTGAEVLISQGIGNVTVGATIISSAGRSIDIQNRTGGTVSFTGAITDNGQGILLNANGASTINFTGGVTLSTGTNPGFTATNGGTVSVTGSANTITTTTGTALSVTNTTIGAAGLTFRSISSNGAPNGIALNNTGAIGGLTVTGNAGTCTSAATCTGGAIQNTTFDGIVLNNTRNVSLTRLFVGATANHGILATAINGLTLSNARIQDAGNGDNEHGLNLVNVTGTVTIDATTFSGAAEDLVHLENNNTNATLNVINNSQFTYPAVIGGFANSAILILPGGTAAITASIQNATFSNIRNQSAQIGANLAASTGTQTFTFSNNTIAATLPGRSGGLFIGGQEQTTTNITVANNTFTGAGGNGVIAVDTNDSARVQGTISGNAITNPPGIGMFIAVDEAATNDIVVDNNTITNSGGDGIQTVNFGGAGVSTMQLALTNNLVNGHSADTGVNFVGGMSITGFEDTSCIVLRGNTVTGTPVGATQCGGAPCVDYYLEEVGGTTILEEVPDTGATTASAAYVNAINDAGPVNVFGVIDLTNGATCNVALMAAGGERSDGESAAALDEHRVSGVLTAAIRGRAGTGASAAGGARDAGKAASLPGWHLTDLAPGQLGRLAGGHIALDRDAAGWGWFVDPTPDRDEEYEPVSPGSNELRARPGGPADGRIDLLTVLMHEMGHVLGEIDIDAGAHPDRLMTAELGVGVRRRPPVVAKED